MLPSIRVSTLVAVAMFAFTASSVRAAPVATPSTRSAQSAHKTAGSPQAALPRLPGDNADNAPGEVQPASPNSARNSTRLGIVQVEQSGHPIAIGTVLSKDGRIITSLSALGTGEHPDVRYSDGTVVKTNVGHKDKTWDLALLVPQKGKWLDGLVPSAADPQNLELMSFAPKGRKLGPTLVAYRGRINARSREGESLTSVLNLDWKGATTVPGAPLIDPDGKVIGITVRACKESNARGSTPAVTNAPQPRQGQNEKKCTPINVGAPVFALRGFLSKTPADAVEPAAWLGLAGAPTDEGNVRGVRVMGVAPSSPAETAGLTPSGDRSDVVVAVDGTPVSDPDELAKIIAACAVGQEVKLLIFGNGKFREVGVTLRAAP
ncbi:MAG: PDZ domain-containing protein [Polyangiaceae bacterium]|nr:PDZ domain-containing protein [Polyangiaceae bacterium]